MPASASKCGIERDIYLVLDDFGRGLIVGRRGRDCFDVRDRNRLGCRLVLIDVAGVDGVSPLVLEVSIRRAAGLHGRSRVLRHRGEQSLIGGAAKNATFHQPIYAPHRPTL